MSNDNTPRWRNISAATPPHIFELRVDWLAAEVGYCSNIPWLIPGWYVTCHAVGLVPHRAHVLAGIPLEDGEGATRRAHQMILDRLRQMTERLG